MSFLYPNLLAFNPRHHTSTYAFSSYQPQNLIHPSSREPRLVCLADRRKKTLAGPEPSEKPAPNPCIQKGSVPGFFAYTGSQLSRLCMRLFVAFQPRATLDSPRYFVFYTDERGICFLYRVARLSNSEIAAGCTVRALLLPDPPKCPAPPFGNLSVTRSRTRCARLNPRQHQILILAKGTCGDAITSEPCRPPGLAGSP